MVKKKLGRKGFNEFITQCQQNREDLGKTRRMSGRHGRCQEDIEDVRKTGRMPGRQERCQEDCEDVRKEVQHLHELGHWEGEGDDSDRDDVDEQAPAGSHCLEEETGCNFQSRNYYQNKRTNGCFEYTLPHCTVLTQYWGTRTFHLPIAKDCFWQKKAGPVSVLLEQYSPP